MQYPVKTGSWPTVQPEDWRTIRPEMDSPEGPKDATADASRRVKVSGEAGRDDSPLALRDYQG